MSQLPFNPDKINFLEQCGFLIAVVSDSDESDGRRQVNYYSDSWRSFFADKNSDVLAVTDLFSPSETSKLNTLLADIEAQGKEAQQSTSVTLQAKDSEHWFECRIAIKMIETERSTIPHEEENNTAKGSTPPSSIAFLFICSDVTESHKKAEEHALLSELATTAGSVLKVGYWQLDIGTRELYWSDEIYDIHQVDKATYKPEVDSGLAFYHPDDVDIIIQHVRTAIHEGIGWTCEQLRILTRKGEERFILTSGNVVLDEAQKPVRLFGILQDITEKEKTYLERDFLATALREATVGMVVADADKHVIWVNHSFERMTGYSLEEVKGGKLGPVLQGDKTNRNTVELLSEKLGQGQAVRTRILNYHKSGAPYWNELSITPIYKEGKLAYYFAVQNDVTAEVEAKQELEKLNLSLEQQVEKRTLDLAKANFKLQQQANIDHLTQCLNRRTLGDTLSALTKEISKQGSHMALLMIDIDYFKSINDTYGHQAGDVVLQSIAMKLKKLLRSEDYIFRMGGEEFLVVMSHLDKEQSYKVAERIRSEISEMTINFEQHNIAVTISIGLFSYNAEISPEKAIKQADDYLYQAKAMGRNKIVTS